MISVTINASTGAVSSSGRATTGRAALNRLKTDAGNQGDNACDNTCEQDRHKIIRIQIAKLVHRLFERALYVISPQAR